MKEKKEYFELPIKVLQSLGAWTAVCAERALPIYENLIDDHRPRIAIAAIQEFSINGKRSNQLRKAAMDAQRASTEIKRYEAASAAAKSASLAAASAFTHPFRDIRQAVHILGPAAYSALAIELDNEKNEEIGYNEITRSIRNISDDVLELLRNYPERVEGTKRIEQLLYHLDHGMRMLNYE